MHNSATTHHAHAACKTLLRPIFTCARIHSECMHFSVICQYAHALRSLSETPERLLTFELHRTVRAGNRMSFALKYLDRITVLQFKPIMLTFVSS